jgi:hypothetical protein
MGMGRRRDTIVRELAARYAGSDLAGAAGARLATELAHHYNGGPVPAEAIAAATERFGTWLNHAVTAACASAGDREDGIAEG